MRQYDAAGNESLPAAHTWTVEGPPPAVERIDASCAGDVLHADAVASGVIGTSFEIALYAAAAGSAYARTGQAVTFVLETSASTHYSHDFDVSALGGDSYKIVSSTEVESNVVARRSCDPGTEVAEAPLGSLLPLSILGTLAVAAAAAYARRRRPAFGLGTTSGHEARGSAGDRWVERE